MSLPLPTPTNFSLNAHVVDQEIIATWDHVAGANHYEVELREWTGTTWRNLGIKTSTESPLVLNDNDDIMASTRYSARVRAMPN